MIKEEQDLLQLRDRESSSARVELSQRSENSVETRTVSYCSRKHAAFLFAGDRVQPSVETNDVTRREKPAAPPA